MPVVEGRSPVIKLVREGLHNGAWQWALVKSVPRFASRSMFGVFTCGCPPRQPIQSFWSSMAMNKIFGFAACAEFASNQPTNRNDAKQFLHGATLL